MYILILALILLPMDSDTEYKFKSRYLKKFPRPSPNPLCYYGARFASVVHAKMRIGCSMLNYDLEHNLHVIPNPNCLCIMGVPETSHHHLLICPWYIIPRRIMINELSLIQNIPPINAELLLYGDKSLDDQTNKLIFKLVHQFIISTNRHTLYTV